jgi:hypothetical protein
LILFVHGWGYDPGFWDPLRDARGTVHFTSEAADVLKDELGYDCRQLPLDACEERAEELARKFAAYRDRIAGESDRATQSPGAVE